MKEEPAVSIERDEYLQRIDRLAALAREAGLNGVVLSAESNIDYFSGYRHHAPWTLFARPFFQVISADRRAALIAHSFLVPEMERTSAVRDIRSYPRWGSASLGLVAEVVRAFGMEAGRVGAELGYEQRLGMSWDDFRALQQALPRAAFVDASALLWRLRTIKSPAEQELLRQSAEATRRAFEACFAAARPGISEREIARIAAETMMRNGAERPGFVLIASGAENYRCLSGKPTDRRLQRGDMLWIDMGAVYDGYWSDFCRAAIIGPPSQEQLDSQKAILEVNQACLDAVKVGEPVKSVAQAAQATFARLGYDVRIGDGRIGHGMGLMSTEPPHTALYEETVMEDGLAFTIEPRFVSAAGVFNCEELLLVTLTGARLLTTAPRELTVCA
jgi:Xaa-Pro aminopeptidase